MSSKRYSSLLLTALFVSSTAAAIAGSKSMLDPYGYVQAPPSKKPKAAVRPVQHETVESTHTTYISMPIREDQQPAAGKKFGLFGGGPKQAKQPKQPKQEQEQVAESNEEKGDGIAAKSIASVKNAGSGIVGGTKAAGSKIAEGSKAVGGGIVSGTKKVGSGIATGAKASGGYIMKGVSVIGNGFKATGEKVKGGAGAAGTKVAGLPKLWGKKDNDQEKAKQQAIAKAIADRKAGKQPADLTPAVAKDNTKDSAKDAEWNEEVANTPADQAVKAPVAVAPVSIPAAKTNHVQAINAKAPANAKSPNKLAGITGGFTKALGKLNVFGGKSNPTMVQPVVRPQSQVQSTASTPEAIPQ